MKNIPCCHCSNTVLLKVKKGDNPSKLEQQTYWNNLTLLIPVLKDLGFSTNPLTQNFPLSHSFTHNMKYLYTTI